MDDLGKYTPNADDDSWHPSKKPVFFSRGLSLFVCLNLSQRPDPKTGLASHKREITSLCRPHWSQRSFRCVDSARNSCFALILLHFCRFSEEWWCHPPTSTQQPIKWISVRVFSFFSGGVLSEECGVTQSSAIGRLLNQIRIYIFDSAIIIFQKRRRNLMVGKEGVNESPATCSSIKIAKRNILTTSAYRCAVFRKIMLVTIAYVCEYNLYSLNLMGYIWK